MANKKIKFVLEAVNKTKAQFDKVSNGLKKIGGGAKAVAGGLLKVAGAFAGVGLAISAVILKTFEYIDTLDKTSKRTGIATDTLQAFQLAALESGSSVEQAQKGLEKFARSIGDAQRGLKTQQDIFRDLGVELSDVDGNTRDFNDILLDTADGLKGFGNEADRATALANLFGRAGLQMSEIFIDGADGIRLFTERAKSLGIILPSKVISNVAKFNDQFAVLKLQLKAVVNNITGALAPALSVLVTDLSGVLTSANEVGEGLEKNAKGFEELGQTIAVGILQTVETALLGIFAVIDALEIKLLKIKSNVLVGSMFGEELTQTERLNLELSETLQEIDKIKEFGLMKKGFGVMEIFASDSAEARAEIERLTTKSLELLGVLGDDLMFTAQTSIPKIQEMIAAILEGGEAFESFFGKGKKGVNDIAAPLTAFKLQLDDVNKSLQTATVSAMKKFEDTIITGLKNGKLEFKAFADYVVEQLLRIAIQQMILKPITGRFESFFASFGKTPSGDGGGYTGMGVRAGGIDGKGGFPAILHPNETIIDHTKGQGMGATVNFNISTVDAAGFDQLLASRKGLITSIINNAMNNQGKMGVV